MIKIKAKVIKESDIRSDFQKSFKDAHMNEGDVYHGWFSHWPEVGSCFILYKTPFNKFDGIYLDISLTTTIVSELITDRIFKTKNSIYKIITIEDERDSKIDNILN